MYQIVLEGCDGSGKSTLATNLADLLNTRIPGLAARVVREPGDSIRGLRDLVLHGQAQTLEGQADGKPVSAASAALLIANMAQTAFAVQQWAGAIAAQGRIPVVIRDRTILTTLIYQGFLGGGPAQVQAIWTAYRSLIDEQFEHVIILTGQHKHAGKADHFTKTGQSQHVRNLYTSIESLLGPRASGPAPGLRDPRLEREMARALTNMDRDSFASRFQHWTYLDTDAYDPEQTAERAYALLSNHYRWTTTSSAE